MQQRDSARWPCIAKFFHFYFMPMAQRHSASHLRCAIQTNAKTRKERERDDDEPDFENQRRACRDVLRADFFL
jgi:hypothetical protein